MIKSHKFDKVFTENMDKAVKEIQNAKLKAPDLGTNKSAYKELEEMLQGSDEVSKILYSGKNTDEIIKELTDENIFAVKFKQIENNPYDPITKALRENCPPSRTLEGAQNAIDKLSSKGEYKVEKLLGTGTIAETYLAKDKTGKEVCVKILKEGISEEKILKDKDKFIELIKKSKGTEQEKEYLLRNLDDLADGILKEVDFKNEMEAAKKLQQFTKKANVVVPIKADKGIYVMEKANGISLEAFQEYVNVLTERKSATKALEKTKLSLENGTVNTENAKFIISDLEETLKRTEEKLAEIRKKSPSFDETFEPTKEQLQAMMEDYINVTTEQFSKIEKTGKTLHADIHPGNIFVDLDAMKTGKGKIFTLIDTGNTVNLSKEQARRSLQLTSYIKKGNIKDIAAYVTEGAALPKGMTKEKAADIVEKELKDIFFNPDIKMDVMNNDSVLELTSSIMKKHDILPNSSQLNLEKAKKSANNSFNALREGFFSDSAIDFEYASGIKEGLSATGSLMVDGAKLGTKKISAEKMQETKNLLKMSPKDMAKQLSNGNNPKTNSKEYITYKLKGIKAMINGGGSIE